MALSNIAVGVPLATVQATLDLRATNKAAFRTAVVTFLKNRFPVAAASLTAADLLPGGKLVVIIGPTHVGIGLGFSDAFAALKAAAGG